MAVSRSRSDSTATRLVGSAVLCTGVAVTVAYPVFRAAWVLPLGSTRLYYVLAGLIPVGSVVAAWGLSIVSTGRMRSLTVWRAIPAAVVAPLAYAVAEFHPDAAQPDTIGWEPPSTAVALFEQVVFTGAYAMLAVPLLFVAVVAVARDRGRVAVAAGGVFGLYAILLIPVDVSVPLLSPITWLLDLPFLAVAVAIGYVGAEPLADETGDSASSV